MQFESLDALLSMGGHGSYVWTAYGLTLLVLAWNLASPLWSQRRFLREQARLARREEVQE